MLWLGFAVWATCMISMVLAWNAPYQLLYILRVLGYVLTFLSPLLAAIATEAVFPEVKEDFWEVGAVRLTYVFYLSGMCLSGANCAIWAVLIRKAYGTKS